jgi:hypothetical protein
MFNPQNWWNELSAFWKIITAVVAGLGTIRAGWTPVSNSWNWIVAQYDKPILGVLEGRKRIEWMTATPTSIVMDPVSVTFVAKVVKRKPKAVLKSLTRLEKAGKIHQGPYGWSWGPRNIQTTPIQHSDSRFNWNRFRTRF